MEDKTMANVNVVGQFYKWMSEVQVPDNFVNDLYERMRELGAQGEADEVMSAYHYGEISLLAACTNMAEVIENIEYARSL